MKPELLYLNPSDMVLKFWTSIFCRYLAPRPATMFRNQLCIDGGVTLFMPPTSASETVFSWYSFFPFHWSALVPCRYKLYLSIISYLSDESVLSLSSMFILIWRSRRFVNLCIVLKLVWRFVFVLSQLLDWDWKELWLVQIATQKTELRHDRCVLKFHTPVFHVFEIWHWFCLASLNSSFWSGQWNQQMMKFSTDSLNLVIWMQLYGLSRILLSQ